MLLKRGIRYRIYPTAEQEDRLVAWDGALRALWNAALEQRRLYRARGAKMASAYDQMLQLTKLRAETPWLAAVPYNIAAQLLTDLDDAWRRYRKKLAREPRFKKKGRDAVSFSEAHPSAFKLTESGVVFPKLGEILAVRHRPITGSPRCCTISREVDQWFVSIQCEENVPDPERRPGPVIAIDRGLTHLLADSDGHLVLNPRHLEKGLRRLEHAQRVVARRMKGSNRRNRAWRRVHKLHRKIRRQRAHVLHVISAQYAKSHGVVVVEKLNVSGMLRGRLGRHISGAGWSMFSRMLRYKLEATGGTLVEVPAQYSSQTCPKCGVVDKASRWGESFCCVACGHRDHADLNAAKVLLSRRNDGDTDRGGFRAVSGPMKRQLRVARRGHSVVAGRVTCLPQGEASPGTSGGTENESQSDVRRDRDVSV